MMSYTDAENGKVALMQEILGVKDIQDIDLRVSGFSGLVSFLLSV